MQDLEIKNNEEELNLNKIDKLRIKFNNLNPNIKNTICTGFIIATMGVSIVAVFNGEINGSSIKEEYRDYVYMNMEYNTYTYAELYYVERDNRLYICTANKEYDNTITYRDVNFQDQIIGNDETIDNVYSVLDVVVDAVNDGIEVDNKGYYLEEYRQEFNEKQIEKEKTK